MTRKSLGKDFSKVAAATPDSSDDGSHGFEYYFCHLVRTLFVVVGR
jgi:hypothetical protein